MVKSGADVAATVLDGVVRRLQEAIDGRNVCFLSTDITADSSKIILTTGVPDSDGEDEERMLLALRTFLSSDPGLPVRVRCQQRPRLRGARSARFTGARTR